MDEHVLHDRVLLSLDLIGRGALLEEVQQLGRQAENASLPVFAVPGSGRTSPTRRSTCRQ
jgi:hypothetical protein